MSSLSAEVEDTLRVASEEARKLGHRSWGSEHVVLALAAENAQRGRRPVEILNQLGIRESRVRGLIERHCPSDLEADEVFAGAEVAYIVTNTRWIAAYLEAVVAEPEHLLLGTLWYEKPESKVLRNLEVAFEDAYREMTGQQPPDTIRPVRPVYVYPPPGDLSAFVRALHAVLPGEATFGFAFDDERAWFSPSPETIDLEEYIPKAQARVAE